MSTIDPTARVEDGAVIGEGTSVGPYCTIGRHVVIGTNCKLISHVHVTGETTIGDGSTVYPFASLGTPPQSLKDVAELYQKLLAEPPHDDQQLVNALDSIGGPLEIAGTSAVP